MRSLKQSTITWLRSAARSRKAIARRAGFLFLALALTLQVFSAFVENEASTARAGDMIPGGVSTKSQILSHYDHNTNNFRDVMTYNGVTREELAGLSAVKQTFTVSPQAYTWGMKARFSEAQGQRSHVVGGGRTVYSFPQSLWGYKTFTG